LRPVPVVSIPVNFLKNLLIPRLSSFVAIPKILSTSTIVSVIMSVIAAIGVTSVYVSRRLKKYPNAFEEFCENIFARWNVLGCLNEDADSCNDDTRRRTYLQIIREEASGFTSSHALIHNRLTPPDAVAENAHRWFQPLRHSSLPLQVWSNSRTWSRRTERMALVE